MFELFREISASGEWLCFGCRSGQLKTDNLIYNSILWNTCSSLGDRRERKGKSHHLTEFMGLDAGRVSKVAVLQLRKNKNIYDFLKRRQEYTELYFVISNELRQAIIKTNILLYFYYFLSLKLNRP